MELPIYKISIDLDDNETGMTAISLVQDPAVEVDFYAFEKQSKPMQFAVQDEMERKVTGCAIWCDKPIYRYDYRMGEYYVVFDKQTIQDIVLKYSKQGLNNMVDLQHNGEMISGITMIEYYIKDTEKGINPTGFEDVADGSLFCTYKVEDDELWAEIIKEGSEFKGFSIEINCDIVPTDEVVEDGYDEDESFWEWLGKWILGEVDGDIEMESQKKKFEVERTDVASAIDKHKVCQVKIGNDKKDYYIHSLGTKDGKDVAVLYNPSTEKWKAVPISTIKEIVVTNKPIGDFVYTDPSYTKVMGDDGLAVQRTAIVTNDQYIDAIENRRWVQISYNDELEKPATGYRQCMVVAYGNTIAGNTAIRVYEQFGDSRSMKDGEGIIPDYRVLRIDRITAFKVMQGFPSWTDENLDSRYNYSGDETLNHPIIDWWKGQQ